MTDRELIDIQRNKGRIARVKADAEFAALLPTLTFRVPIEGGKGGDKATFKDVRGLKPEQIEGFGRVKNLLSEEDEWVVVTIHGQKHAFPYAAPKGKKGGE